MTAKIGQALSNRLQTVQNYEVLEVVIFLSAEPAQEALESAANVADAPVDRAAVVEQMQRRSQEDQAELVDFLNAAQAERLTIDDEVSVPQVGRIEQFWINNSVRAELTPEMLQKIIERPDVSHVELVRHVDPNELLDAATARDRSAATSRRPRKMPEVDAPTNAAAPTWSVTRVGAPLLWQRDIKGQGVLVAVVDTGVNYYHPDLQARMWVSASYPKHGYDFDANDDDPMDQQGHGTSCAGIVAGTGVKGKATGVAPGATIMAVRVGGSEDQFWRGLQFAINNAADVISMSMSWKYPSSPDYPGWRRSCEAILAVGVLHANSIGNQGEEASGRYPIPYNIATPGNCPAPRLHPLQTIVGGVSSAIACGATHDTDQLASYSGRGPAAWESTPYVDYPYAGGRRIGLLKPDLCAPGPGTESCNWLYDESSPHSKPYSPFGGTSSATPHVAGCLALLACACRKSGKPIVPAQIQEALENTAVRIPGQLRDKENHYGAGRVDVHAAYLYGVAKGWWSTHDV